MISIEITVYASLHTSFHLQRQIKSSKFGDLTMENLRNQLTDTNWFENKIVVFILCLCVYSYIFVHYMVVQCTLYSLLYYTVVFLYIIWLTSCTLYIYIFKTMPLITHTCPYIRPPPPITSHHHPPLSRVSPTLPGPVTAISSSPPLMIKP